MSLEAAIQLQLQLEGHSKSPIEERLFKLPSFSEDVAALYVYGVAPDFSELQQWLEESPNRKALIFEDNPGAIIAFLEDYASILTHPRIQLRFLTLETQKEAIGEYIAHLSPTSLEVAAVNVYQERLAPIQLLFQRRFILWNALLSESLQAPYFYKNLLTNLKHLPRSFSMDAWKDRLQGTPAIICGAGPSLTSVAPKLRLLKDKTLILGGGSALSALSHLQIEPDLGIAVDPNPPSYEAVKKCSAVEIPLLYCSRVFPQVLSHFRGPLGYIRAGTGGALERYMEESLGIGTSKIGVDLTDEAMSVTTLAASVALFLGCNPIIFAGVDLAYHGNQMYTPGVETTVVPSLYQIASHDRFGKEILTKVEWMMEASALTHLIQLHKDRSFYNLSEGLPIEGAAPTDLALWMERPLQKFDWSFSPLQLKPIRPFLQKLLESLQRCEQIVIQLQALPAQSGLAVALEDDFYLEEAYAPLLQEVMFAHHIRHPETFSWNRILEVTTLYKDAIYSAMSEG